MFAVVTCPGCKRMRIVDLSAKTSECAFCGTKSVVKELQPVCRCRTQETAREHLAKLTGSAGGIEPKHARRSTDPYSTLERDYEKAHSLEDKMEVMSKGLTRIYGEFTEDDVVRLDPKHGKKLLGMMLAECIVHETKYGRYKR